MLSMMLTVFTDGTVFLTVLLGVLLAALLGSSWFCWRRSCRCLGVAVVLFSVVGECRHRHLFFTFTVLTRFSSVVFAWAFAGAPAAAKTAQPPPKAAGRASSPWTHTYCTQTYIMHFITFAVHLQPQTWTITSFTTSRKLRLLWRHCLLSL